MQIIMNRPIAYLLAATLLPLSALAQKAKLISATEQCWSGGIAGSHGCNYTFSIEFDKANKTLMPDTLWIGEHMIPLFTREKATDGGNMGISRKKNTTKVDVRAGTSEHDQDRMRPHPPGEDDGNEAKPTPPKAYKGVALLCYRYNGKRRYYEISRITERKPHISYP